jgi:Flp pilus assembly protein TadG
MASVSHDRGSVTVELVVLAPVVLALLLFTVGLGRIEDAQGQVDGAARDAARAASMASDAATAGNDARRAAAADMAGTSLDCRNLTVDVDTSGFRAGGDVVVRVACTADLSDLAVSGLPGSKTLTAASAAPIETYRGVTP